MKRVVQCLAAIGLVASVVAAPSVGTAYRAEVLAEPAATWLRLQVPAAALASVQYADARDVQVQDASGQALARLPVFALTPEHWQHGPRLTALPWHEASGGAGAGLQLEWRADGHTQLRIQAPSSPARKAEWAAVLLDTRQLTQPVQSLLLDMDVPANHAVDLQLESSADMQHWTGLAATATVYAFGADGGQAVVNRRIRLQQPWQAQGQYLRIRWQSGVALNIRSAVPQWAEYAAASWEAVDLGPAQSVQPDRLEWALPFAWPVLGLAFSLPETSPAVYWPYQVQWQPAKRSAGAAHAAWQPLAWGQLWRTADGLSHQQIALSAPHVGAGHGRLALQSRQAGQPAPAALNAQALVAPLELVVLASGQPPYTLVVGATDAPAPTLQAAQLPAMGLADWQALPRQQLGPAQRQTRQALSTWQRIRLDLETHRGQWALWLVLLLATALLVAAVWSQWKSLKR